MSDPDASKEQAESPPQAAASPPRVTSEAAKAFIERRLRPQLAWYDARSKHAKDWHFWLMGTQLIATSAIPVVNVLTHSIIASSVLAGVAAIATGFAQMTRHHEHWITYREAANALESLHLRYEIGLPPFDGDDRHDLLISQADKILGEEGSKWTAAVRQTTKPARAPKVAATADDDDG